MSAKQFKVGDIVHNCMLGEFVIGETCKHPSNGQVQYLPKGGYYANGDCATFGVPAYNLTLIKAAPKRDYVADHARRTLRKAGLSKEEARQVVENWTNKKVPLSSLSRKLPDSLHGLLMGAFTWAESPQGFEYWDAVYVRELYREEKEQNAQAQ